MILEPDVKALVTLLPVEKGGRKSGASSGYRPQHLVAEGILTSGSHTYLNYGYVLPGDSSPTLIKFVTPENYPNCLWVGKTISLREGNRIIGYAEIEHIFNPILIATTP